MIRNRVASITTIEQLCKDLNCLVGKVKNN